MKKEYSGGKATQQVTYYSNIEKIWENRIRTVAVERSFTHQHDIVILIWSTIFKFVVFFINNAQFVKNL